MLEISPTARLVRHGASHEPRWQLQQRAPHASYTNRDIWQPMPTLMDSEQTLGWLTRSAASSSTIEAFRTAAGLG